MEDREGPVTWQSHTFHSHHSHVAETFKARCSLQGTDGFTVADMSSVGRLTHFPAEVMLEESQPPSPRGALALVPSEHDWQPIFHVSNQVVLYNPTSHALSIRPSSNFPPRARRPCPYCKQDLPSDFQHESDLEDDNMDSEASFRASNYFQLLAIANETTSRPSTPPTPNDTQSRRNTFPAEAMAEGYFKAFFQEECRLGMGANGSVYLCQVCLSPHVYPSIIS